MLGQVGVAHQRAERFDNAVDQPARRAGGDAVGLHGAAEMVQRIAQVVDVRRLAGLGLRRLAGIGVHVDDLVRGAGAWMVRRGSPGGRRADRFYSTRTPHPSGTPNAQVHPMTPTAGGGDWAKLSPPLKISISMN
ncbi:hypothetical protein CBM2606_A120097 [Cupriavidus taiwanensis]|nr:hypothetical protein CBM2606_A120097 [Cupriavidus taiwanensis]